MARTLSASPIDPNKPSMGSDVDNRVVEGLEALRQPHTAAFVVQSGRMVPWTPGAAPLAC